MGNFLVPGPVPEDNVVPEAILTVSEDTFPK